MSNESVGISPVQHDANILNASTSETEPSKIPEDNLKMHVDTSEKEQHRIQGSTFFSFFLTWKDYRTFLCLNIF